MSRGKVIPAAGEDTVAAELRAEQAEVERVQQQRAQIVAQMELPPYELQTYVAEIKTGLINTALTLLRTGHMLAVIREHEGVERWNEIAEQLGLSQRQGQRMIAASLRFAERNKVAAAITSSTKLLELMTEDDDTLDAIEAGSIAGLTLDDIDRMSTRELRAELRKARQNNEALERVNGEKAVQIDKLARRLDTRDGGALEERLTETLQALEEQVITTLAAVRALCRSATAANEIEAEFGSQLDLGTAERIANARASCAEGLQGALRLVEE